MGLKPTQYRCASESLLRRFRKEGSLPPLHPAADLCKAVSLAFATPIAVFDLAEISGGLQVRYAAGDEQYLTFGGGVENPSPHEGIFAAAAWPGLVPALITDVTAVWPAHPATAVLTAADPRFTFWLSERAVVSPPVLFHVYVSHQLQMVIPAIPERLPRVQ